MTKEVIISFPADATTEFKPVSDVDVFVFRWEIVGARVDVRVPNVFSGVGGSGGEDEW